MKQLYFVPFFILILTACTSVILGGGQQAGVHVQHDERTLKQVSQDSEITQNVRRLLGSSSAIAVSTANGVVTLQGSASSQREVQRLISQIYRIHGVQGVNSQLVVRTP